MRQRIRSHLTYANVMATIAVFLVLSGGTAVALTGSNTVFSDDIVNGEVKVADIGQGAVATDEIANGQVQAADIGDGEVRSADIGQAAVAADELAANSVRAQKIADGQVGTSEIATSAVRTGEIGDGEVQAQDLAATVKPGASGARAWGLVDGGDTLVRKKNVTAVTHEPASGIYCIDPGSGIDPTTAVMVVGEALPYSATSAAFNDVSHVEWDSTAPDCPVGTMEVRTFVGLADAHTFGETDVGGFTVQQHIQGFTFVIP
jgi:hypothetical protein